ncbi:LOW QUALITY PROTEIN: uncharacterized protein LOC111523586 [Piliocolobus tephrosceles]|uniref:LOW QUALITY PROTEIN: uncharacterized protein LOC111523586 n=1 Tax=Piliocolobus tephrosceles TaxID=591936 RepID=UPI000E6B0C1C|nr:LOW QUALITY PROTEIN: uncharacterized protein LOC111523586 [Piliocolobus tephrosceles]
MSSERAGPQNKKTYASRAQCRYRSRIFHSRTCPSSPRASPPPAQSRAVPAPTLSSQPHHSLPLPQSQQVFRSVAAASRGTQFPPSAPHHPGPCPLIQVRPQLCPPRLVKLDHHTPSHALPSVKGSSRQKLDQRTFTEQVHEGKDNGYLFSKKIASGAFSKVYLADATHECVHHNPKLSSDLQGKRHTMIAVKIISATEAPVEFSRKLLPREISSLNTTYKHLNVVGRGLDTACPHPPLPQGQLSPASCLPQAYRPRPPPWTSLSPQGWSPTASWNLDLVQLYETYQSSQLVLELVAQGDLLEHINAALDPLYHPGLEEKEVLGLFWQLVSAMAHYHSVGIAYQRGRHLGLSDLKCKNILLDDHGLLRLTGEPTAPALTPSPGLNASTCRGPHPTLVPARPLPSALPGLQATLTHGPEATGLTPTATLPMHLVQILASSAVWGPGTHCSALSVAPQSTQPEILVSSKYSRQQADLWSLGVILYAMVSKKLPFKEPQPHCMLHLMHCGPTFWPGLFPEKQVQSPFPASMDDLEPGTDLERQWPVL